MNEVLSQMVDQFAARHNRQPEKIVVAPLASLALALKRSLAPDWRGIRVECRDMRPEEATRQDDARSLGVFLKPSAISAQLVCCDLKT